MSSTRSKIYLNFVVVFSIGTRVASKNPSSVLYFSRTVANDSMSTGVMAICTNSWTRKSLSTSTTAASRTSQAPICPRTSIVDTARCGACKPRRSPARTSTRATWQPKLTSEAGALRRPGERSASSPLRHPCDPRGHAIWGQELLKSASVDSIRLCLSHDAPERTQTSFNMDTFKRYASESLKGSWSTWLEGLDQRLGKWARSNRGARLGLGPHQTPEPPRLDVGSRRSPCAKTTKDSGRPNKRGASSLA